MKNKTTPTPIQLEQTRAWRPFLGGKLLDQLHGIMDSHDGPYPEEWIMSVVSASKIGPNHTKDEGLTKLYNEEMTLKALIGKDPAFYLGRKHAARYHEQPGVLLKLIDAATRLKIQVHPNKKNAMKYFQSNFGKTECWHILGGRTIDGIPPHVYLGFKEHVTLEKWKELFQQQDIDGMLDCLHRYDVQAGDTFLIPGGIPHAIGAGCFLVEIQEPTDYTIRMERTHASSQEQSDTMCHQGIGFQHMFQIFDYNGLSREATLQRFQIKHDDSKLNEGGSLTSIISYDDTPYFKMNEWKVSSRIHLERCEMFYGLYVLDGIGKLTSADTVIPIKKGDSFFIPANTEQLFIDNIQNHSLRVLQFFGPNL